MLVRTRGTALAIAVTVAVSACTVKEQEAPPISGPSELGTSLSLAANPDILPLDGFSQSQIVIQARDGSGQPIRNLPLSVEIVINGVTQDYGRLSAKNVSTGSDGRATLTYTAPVAVDSVDRRTTVSIMATPLGTDASGHVGRLVDIRLVPPGIITPPGPGVPNFTISPTVARQLEPVQFNASDPALDGVLVSYDWDFGDGSRGTGRIVEHQYRDTGVYTVTLTVADNAGAKSTLAKNVTIERGLLPSASFSYSPVNPGVGTDIFFNASGSLAAPGRRLVAYDWEFGDGGRASGVVVSHSFNRQGTYVVTLVVTDDTGVQNSSSTVVGVSDANNTGLSADFTVSPSSPTAGATVFFNAETSTSADPIVEYRWDFGDGAQQVGGNPRVSHVFGAEGDYIVTLTIRDSEGRTSTRTRPVAILQP